MKWALGRFILPPSSFILIPPTLTPALSRCTGRGRSRLDRSWSLSRHDVQGMTPSRPTPFSRGADPRYPMDRTIRSPLVGAVALFLAAAGIPQVSRASSPELQIIQPRGAQRGTEVDVTFRGNRLADAKDVIAYDPGITVEKVEVVGPQEVKAHLKI